MSLPMPSGTQRRVEWACKSWNLEAITWEAPLEGFVNTECRSIAEHSELCADGQEDS